MKNQCSTPSGRLLLLTALCSFVFVSPAFAQQAPGPPQIDRRVNPERARQQDMSKREWQLRNPGPPPEVAADRRQLEALMAQTEEDFNRILMLHNKIAHASTSEQLLDYGFVLTATAEIKKRASRLQTTLALRESEKSKETSEKLHELNDPQMKEELIGLCKQIRKFVTNPVIENPGTVHLEHLETARRDLASIVRLSGHISKHADKLNSPR
jgi:hypothetical protein